MFLTNCTTHAVPSIKVYNSNKTYDLTIIDFVKKRIYEKNTGIWICNGPCVLYYTCIFTTNSIKTHNLNLP